MAWYEAHQTMAKHPKTLKLSSLIKCERRYAVGLLHDLFAWGLDAAKKDGTLPGLSADEIAAALDFSGKKGRAVVEALVASGYLELTENGYKIHDWYDYAGKFADQREDAKRRKDAWKERKLNSDGTRTEQFQNSSRTVPERGKNAPTVPNRTVPYNTRDSVCNARAREGAVGNPQPSPKPDRWEEFWDAYPRKSGGDIREACMEYLKAIDAGADPAVLIAAAKALAARTDRDTFRYLPKAEKWLRNQGWLEKPPDESEDNRTNNIFLQILDEERGNQ